MTTTPPHTENSYSPFKTQIQTPLFCDAPQCPVTFGASRTAPLVPLNSTHPPRTVLSSACPHPTRGIVRPGAPVELEEQFGSDPEAQPCWNSCPISKHTHTQKPTPLSANWQAPTDVYRLPPPRTPAPRPLPRSLGLPAPAPPKHKATPLACAPTNSGASDKARHPRARPAARTGQNPAGVGRRGPRARPPREVLTDGQAPAPSEAPRPAGAGPRPPLFPPEAPARSSQRPRDGHGRLRGVGPRPPPLRAPTGHRAARPGRRLARGALLPPAPGPRPRPLARHAAAPPAPPPPAPCPAAGSAPRR